MRLIILDDERASIENLEYYLKRHNDIKILAKYQDPREALQSITNLKPDVVFLDISMPEISGLQVASEIIKQNKSVKIVFITAYSEYAIKAFELNAIDYIIKPVSSERINLTLERLRITLKDFENKQYKKENTAIINEASKNELIKIPVWKNERIFLFDPTEITYLFSEERNVKIIFSGNSYVGKNPLNYYEEKLQKNRFFRCHKSYIVNTTKINEVIPWFNNTYMIRMEGLQEEIPVSRSYIKKFKKLFDL